MSSLHDHDHDDEEERQRLQALWKPEQARGLAGGLKAHRHIHIDWPNASIKKVIAIGASAPDASPPVYDRPRAENEANNAASCVLITKSSPINATIHILNEAKSRPTSSSDQPVSSQKKLAEKPVLISALTGSLGSVTLLLPSYVGARPLNIRAKSNNGNITIYLPSSFAGLLNWSSETGTLKVSKAMQQRFKALDSPPHKHRGMAKIVPSTASGFRGDVCAISNNHGSITIKDFDEDAAGGGGGGGGEDKSCLIQ